MSGDTAAAFSPVRYLRGVFNRFFIYIGELSFLVARASAYVGRGNVDLRDVVNQMSSIGFNSVPIVVLTTLSSGSVIALYFAPFLIKYGAADLTGAVVALAIGRELAPVLVGVVVAARAGSAIAAEIGTMKVSEQIDALRALAVSPIQYLVVPRLLACVFMLPVLCLVADIAGLLGGYYTSTLQGVPPSSFPESIRLFVDWRDFTMGMVKTIIFGIIIALVGCHQGLVTRGGATEVGKATTNAVVLSIVLIYVANLIMAYLMFGGASNV